MKRLVPYLLILSFSTFLAVFGLWWLALGVIVIAGIAYFVGFWKNLQERLSKHRFVSGILLIFAVVLLAVLLRVFVFEIYSIPSGSMETTLVPGDKIVVSKLSFGPALPRSPLEVPWFNALFLLNKKAIAANDTFVWYYYRLPGFRNLQRGNVVVFRYPPDPHENYIKRCVALPGDTVQVAEGILYVNGKPQLLPATARMEYKVWPHDRESFQHFADSLHLPVTGPWTRRQDNYRILNLTTEEVSIIKKSESVDSVAEYVIDGTKTGYRFTMADTTWYRSADNYGPFVVPRKGMSIPLNEENLEKYKSALRDYEHFRPDKTEKGYRLNGIPVTDYTFRQDYYFMMGDNRHRSNDSRMWGVVPEELITGKATIVLWSGGFKGFRWNRLLRRIW